MADSEPTSRRTRTPSASASTPERRPDADESFTLSRWQESPAAHGYDSHVLAGAAALAGWKPGTKLTKSELKEGVAAFQKHKPTSEEGS